MKNSDQTNFAGRSKPNKPKKTIKRLSSVTIAQRYLALQQLRLRVSQAEARLEPR